MESINNGTDFLDEKTGVQFIWVSSGEMSVRTNTSERISRAVFSKGFWLAKHPVTFRQYRLIHGEDSKVLDLENDKSPAANLNWEDASKFCKLFSVELSPNLPEGYFVQLPTSLQWEYCCRSGRDLSESQDPALSSGWFSENSENKTHPVGQLDPDAWGFHDMFGNVSEWCIDAPFDHYPETILDWHAPATTNNRILRGGHFARSVSAAESAFDYIGYCIPNTRHRLFGFRVAITC